MGALLTTQVPVPDERMLQTIAKLKLKDRDLRILYSKFCKYDLEERCSKSGTIDRTEFYKSIDEKDSEIGDAIFALIDDDNSGVLDFSEYVDALGKFCALSRLDILRFCFNVFDSDRSGTIEGNELNHLLEILHDDGQTSNIRQAMKSFDFNDDGKVDFEEFQQLNTQFPTLLYPAFRIQQNMRIYTMGETWWRKKIEELLRDKQEELARLQAQGEAKDANSPETKAQREAAALKAKQKRQEQAIKIRMGCMQYYCCPCRRNRYIIDETQADEPDSDDEDDAKSKAPSPAKSPQKAKQGKKENIVKVGQRKPLTQEQRLERARKRRMRDMQDRPTRKD
ncbi:TPA: hypothetical protein N0F65_002553 [Lagenidium giganteum]|uniref:EF-hand domain-containing protein n=1 Tax=Lagenidium giganteum TaxID=4803 RepID=A0AAV2YHJ4_9STRA|nr:TPA: hypothetical protein N0F65_002553 [Lagenidium giganteum]